MAALRPARGSAKTWLCQLARTTALDHWRSERRRRGREDAYVREEPFAAEGPLVPGLSPDLERALLSLSAAEREVVALRVLLELEGLPRPGCSGSARPPARRGCPGP